MPGRTRFLPVLLPFSAVVLLLFYSTIYCAAVLTSSALQALPHASSGVNTTATWQSWWL